MKLFVSQLHSNTQKSLREESLAAHTEYWEWGDHATRMAIQRKVPFGVVREVIEHGDLLEYNISDGGTRHVLLGFITSDGMSTKVALDLDRKEISTCYQNKQGDKHFTLDTRAYRGKGTGRGRETMFRD